MSFDQIAYSDLIELEKEITRLQEEKSTIIRDIQNALGNPVAWFVCGPDEIIQSKTSLKNAKEAGLEVTELYSIDKGNFKWLP